MNSYIYLIQDGKYKDTNTYKVGRTTQKGDDTRALRRLKQYSKHSIVKHTIEVSNEHVIAIEKEIIEEFQKQFILVEGKEWFSGDKMEMISIIIHISKKYDLSIIDETTSISTSNVDMNAAKLLYKLYPYWVNCQNELYVFNDQTGMWENNLDAYIGVLTRFSDHLHIVVERGGKMIKTEESYGNTLTLMEKIPPLMKTLCINNNWLNETQYSSLGKILFNNGYYDFHTRIFYSKEEYGFNPLIVFMGKIHHDFIPLTVDDLEYMEDIKQRLFYNSFGFDNGNHFILHLAKALTGEKTNTIIFAIGPTNCGKSVLANACYNSLGDYCGLFYIDSEKNDKKIERLKYKRVIISNNHTPTLKHCNNFIRNVMDHEHTFFLPIVFDNCLPNSQSNIHPFTFMKTYVQEPKDDTQLKMDDKIREEVRTLKFNQLFVHILIDAYNRYHV
jgi:T5orf172 domain